MPLELAFGGWCLALAAAAVSLAARWARAQRMERLARAAHELRGALCAARLGLALAAHDGELRAPRLRAMELELERAALALEDLQGHRVPRGFEQVDVQALLGDVVEAWGPAAGARGVLLHQGWLGAGGVVCGERIRLVQAIGNLIANAIEHGGGIVEAGGRIEGDRVKIEVSDTGVGLPAPVSELARRARRGRGSRGRGLAIAAEIARAHGGRLAAAPSDRGARLIVDLPATRALAPRSQAS
jgi:signal transduction histidine kinase